jgi:putative transposase
MKIGVKTICRVLGLNRSGYYAWKKRPMPQGKAANLRLVSELKVIHEKSRGTYGSPRITEVLNSKGLPCGRHRIARIMQKEGIFGCARRKFRPITTDSKHNYPIAPRVFKIEHPNSLPKKPNQVWVSDTTYVSTLEGWLYLTIQLDVFTRKIVGYSMANNLRTDAVWESMQKGIIKQEGALSIKEPNLIAHSDRGTQYASAQYREKLENLGIIQSMSRSGNCYDNAFAESFFHTLKVELVHRQEFKTRAQAEKAIQEYIDNWYNSMRLHSGLGYKAPLDYERQALAA